MKVSTYGRIFGQHGTQGLKSSTDAVQVGMNACQTIQSGCQCARWYGSRAVCWRRLYNPAVKPTSPHPSFKAPNHFTINRYRTIRNLCHREVKGFIFPAACQTWERPPHLIASLLLLSSVKRLSGLSDLVVPTLTFSLREVTMESNITSYFKLSAWALEPEASTFAPSSRWSNKDMDPVPPLRRTWTTWNYIAYWISDAANAAVWELASSMLAIGLSW